MDISVIEELKNFEAKQESALEQKKKGSLNSLEQKKKEILEKNKMQIQEIYLSKPKIIKRAQEKAKEQALATINSFKEKIKKLKASSSARTEQAVNQIFSEFLKQNV